MANLPVRARWIRQGVVTNLRNLYLKGHCARGVMGLCVEVGGAIFLQTVLQCQHRCAVFARFCSHCDFVKPSERVCSHCDCKNRREKTDEYCVQLYRHLQYITAI